MSNNLPITLKAPQAPAKPAQATPQAEGDAPQGQPFGDVLARQVAESGAANESDALKKSSPKTAGEIFAQLQANTDAAAIPPDATTTTLPTDMLAALLPQVQPVPPQNAGTVSSGEIAKQTTTTAVPTELGVNQKSTSQSGNTPIAAHDDTAFTSMLEKLTAKTANTASLAEEKLVLAAPQPTATALASLQSGPLNPVNVMPAQITLNTPITQDRWGDEFNQKITWLATSKEQSAELHLNPPQLGPMDVVLKVSGDQATALFTSPHAAVREAIEQALPKLREMMAENGIMLGNATVSDQASRNDQNGSDQPGRRARAESDAVSDSIAPSNVSRVSPIRQHNGIVDTFA